MTNPVAMNIPSNGHYGLEISSPTIKQNKTYFLGKMTFSRFEALEKEIYKMSQENLAILDNRETTKDK